MSKLSKTFLKGLIQDHLASPAPMPYKHRAGEYTDRNADPIDIGDLLEYHRGDTHAIVLCTEFHERTRVRMGIKVHVLQSSNEFFLVGQTETLYSFSIPYLLKINQPSETNK